MVKSRRVKVQKSLTQKPIILVREPIDTPSAAPVQRGLPPNLHGHRIDQQRLTPQAIMTLQRTIGNAAVSALLRQQAADFPRQAGTTHERGEHTVGSGIGGESPRESSPSAPATSVAVQRAMGLELEAFDWHVQHGDQSRLPKGTEPVITDRGGKYVLSADDDGAKSDIEYVTEPLNTRKESKQVIGRITSLAKDLEKAGKGKKLLPATGFKRHGIANPDAFLIPGFKMDAHMQATLSVPLEKVPTLFEQLGAGKAGNEAKIPANKSISKVTEALEGSLPGGIETPSDQLKGFLMLAIDYIVQGFVAQNLRQQHNHRQFPKGVLHLLAKTRFDKMLKSVPEYEQLIGEDEKLKSEWIDWIVQAALGKLEEEALTEAREDTVLNQTFGEKGEDPYTIGVTREEWLGNMPKDDLLSEKRDIKSTEDDKRHLQGMGAFGKGVDILSEETKVGFIQKLLNNCKKKGRQSTVKDGKKGKENRNEILSGGKQSEGKQGPSKEAPIFELRQLGFGEAGPDQWQSNVDKLWDMHDEILGKSRYRKQEK